MEAKYINQPCHQQQAGSRDRVSRADGLGSLPPADSNLVTRAVELIRAAAGVDLGADIDIVKRIPASAGLGGASSDAAAALQLANHAWRIGWSTAQLRELAAELGSDVPFFLGDGDMALCRGRGELIEPISTRTRIPMVVVRPPHGLGTAAVYGACQPATDPVSVTPLLGALNAGHLPEVGRRLFNRLQQAASQLSSWIERLVVTFRRLDCLGFQMSGSGSSFFGVCRHHGHARRLASQLRAAGIGHVFTVSSVPPRCRISAVPT